jgi:hypothetical protein
MITDHRPKQQFCFNANGRQIVQQLSRAHLINVYRQARIHEFLVEGDDMDDKKIDRGLGTAVGPKRGPGAEPLVGVSGLRPL